MSQTESNLRVLMITSEWPTREHPEHVPFILRQVVFLRRAGVNVEVFKFKGSRRPQNYLRAWIRVQRRLRTGHFDLIHAQWGQSGLLAIFPKRLPVVVTFRGDDLHGIVGPGGRYTWAGRMLATLSRIVAARADKVIVVSPHLTKLLPDRECHVIPSGLDLDLFRPAPRDAARQALGLPLDRPLILFCGAPQEPRKRYQLAREAVEIVKADYPDVELVTAARVPHRSVWLYMNACDALILTSVHEGSPNVVKEALACDLPVVSVDVGDVRQRIGGVDGCVVCSEDSPSSLSEGLTGVLKSGGRVAGREAVRDLDERLLARQVIAVYRAAVARTTQHERISPAYTPLGRDQIRRAG